MDTTNDLEKKFLSETRKNRLFFNLIHYLGDDMISKPAPHSNSLKQTKFFFRTKPSAMNTG